MKRCIVFVCGIICLVNRQESFGQLPLRSMTSALTQDLGNDEELRERWFKLLPHFVDGLDKTHTGARKEAQLRKAHRNLQSACRLSALFTAKLASLLSSLQPKFTEIQSDDVMLFDEYERKKEEFMSLANQISQDSLYLFADSHGELKNINSVNLSRTKKYYEWGSATVGYVTVT